jgi:uncharacterized protein DUF1552
MPSKPILTGRSTRRSLLKTAALGALLGPVLRRRDALAAESTSPRRIILIYSPNGACNASGPAFGSETAFTFHDWWSPLDRHRSDGIFISHAAVTGASIVPSMADADGLAEGHGLGGQVFAGYGCVNDIYTSGGPTIDVTIGRYLQAQNRAGAVRSVHWGLETSGGAFWADAARTSIPEGDPSAAWSSLFSSFMPPAGDPAAMQRAAQAIARRKSMLDFVIRDCASMQSVLGSEGMRLLDDHCTTLRQMERNLGTAIPMMPMSSCLPPQDPGANDWTNPENIDAQMNAFIALMAMALACELTHVVAFQFGGQGARNRLASSYGVPVSGTVDSGDSGPAHHPWTHNNLGTDNTHLALSIFQKFYSSKVALLVDKLKSTNDLNGKPLLDSSVVLWISELGGADNNGYEGHICSQVPIVLFGNGQHTFRTGRYLHGPSTTISTKGDVEGGQMAAQVLVSMLQYMGLPDTTVGLTEVSGPLALL